MPRGVWQKLEPSQEDLAKLAGDLQLLKTMNLPAMRVFWRERLKGPYPPRLRSPEIFRGLLGRKLREAVEGGLSPAAQRKLREIEAKAQKQKDSPVQPLPKLSPGVRLEREWRGALFEVDVVEGGFVCRGARYASLSETARAITGVRWNGPRFFGLQRTR